LPTGEFDKSTKLAAKKKRTKQFYVQQTGKISGSNLFPSSKLCITFITFAKNLSL